MKATEKQLNYIEKLMGETYSAEYDKLTVKTASVLISAIVAYKRPVLIGSIPVDDTMLSFLYENLCHAEITAFGHTFATHKKVKIQGQ
jgi:hypothetical protein